MGAPYQPVPQVFWPHDACVSRSGYVVGFNVHSLVSLVVTVVPFSSATRSSLDSALGTRCAEMWKFNVHPSALKCLMLSGCLARVVVQNLLRRTPPPAGC